MDDGAYAHLPGRTLLYAYPRTGRPDEPLPTDWDLIPVAWGCLPQSCAFRDHHAGLWAAGGGGAAAPPLPPAVGRGAKFHSDARAPHLRGGRNDLLRRVTLIVRNGVVEPVFSHVFPPDRNPADVLACLEVRPA